ncbi:MAG: hypothetical protein IT371_29830 [Deltaproteobacteria bacterium]|nr:hypothetical protein [Deltaproteobacteria bacterium]
MKPGTIIPLAVTLRREEVLRLLGYPEEREPPRRIGTLLESAFTEARGLVRARGTYLRLPKSRATEVRLPPVEAQALTVGLVTAGAELEGRVAELADAGDLTRALLLDAMGSAAAEEAADRLSAIISAGGETDAPAAGCRLSPGYGDWPLAAQTSLFALLPSQEVGVSLLPSMLMQPRKSVSFAMWLGARGIPAPGLSGCERCGLVTCRYRRKPRSEPQ